ncbi:MAG: hypothetical protein E7172_00720 [Firmicutes bacterium]|nr:hypothetical protein [Bacillota bacterium]
MKLKHVVGGLLLCVFQIGSVWALEEKNFYLPERNTYYQRSQHTYSFLDQNNELNTAYAPSIYTLLSDLEEAKVEDTWTFTDKYTIPWNVKNNDYFIVYCADIDAPVEEQLAYRQINLQDSTYINEDIKANLAGILKNSYPYISKQEMINRLIEAKVLENYDNGYDTVLTTVGNEFATNDITIDELVSATQMAINHYTNPNSIQKIYDETYRLSAKMILREHNLWTNEYSAGFYDEVNYNINAIFNYLITLKSELPSKMQITKTTLNSIENNLYIHLNKDITNNDNLEFSIIENNNIVNTYNLKKLNQRNDGAYIVPLSGANDILNVDVDLKGTQFVENYVFVYEAIEGETQTMIGVSTGPLKVNSLYTESIEDEVASSKIEQPIEEIPENPPTGVKLLIIPLIISIIASLTFIKKKNKIEKI